MVEAVVNTLGLAGYVQTLLSASVAGLLIGHALQRWFGLFIVIVIVASRFAWVRRRFT